MHSTPTDMDVIVGSGECCSSRCEGTTVFVTDTAAGAVKLITPTTSLCKCLEFILGEYQESKMRSRNDMPTVLEFAHLFAPTIRESLKQLTDTGFLYYTSPSSYYEAPETMQLAFQALPSVPCQSSVQMTKEDQQLMRDWRDNYGKPVRQLTVRNQSTKDNVGTLPIFVYTTPDPPPQPLNFSTLVNQPVRISRSEDSQDSTAPTEIRGTVLFQSGAVLVVKHDHIREVSTNGPFFIGCVETDVTDNDEDSYFDIQIYVPTFDDCLHFTHHKKCNVHRDAVVSIADENAFQKGEDFIKLSEELYEQLLNELHDIADILPECESCDSDDESDKEYTPVQTSSGRRVVPPNRLDL
ncbi:hypothetical protein ACROYT_G014102 [Oculina patagonica]